MSADKYEFTPDDDRLTFEVNAVICAHPELFREAGRQIDLLYSIDAVRERQEKPITDEVRASMVRNARSARDRQALRSLFPPHRRDIASVQVRFPYVVRDFFDRPLLPIPSPGLEWASDKLLRYWLLTSPADAKNAPVLTEFQKWSWDGDLGDDGSGRMGRYIMQWLDSTGSIWPEALKAVRRALEVVKLRIAHPFAPDIANAARAFVAPDHGVASELLGVVDTVLAPDIPGLRAGPLRRWCLGRKWPAGSDVLRTDVGNIEADATRVENLYITSRNLSVRDPEEANRINREMLDIWRRIHRQGEAVIAAVREALSPEPPEKKVAPAGRSPLSVDMRNKTALVRGEPYPLTVQQAEIVDRLVRAGGGWVTAKTLKALDSKPTRPDRAIKGLPGPVRDCIESKSGSGYRVKVE